MNTRKIACAPIMFALLIAISLILASKAVTVESDLEVIVVPDDFLTVQEGIDNANGGDTIFVRNGIYYENLVIDKSISLIGEDKNRTIIDGNKTGHVVRVTTSDVYLRNLTIRNSRPATTSPRYMPGDSGIYLELWWSYNITIRDNVITDCYVAIEIPESHSNTIEDNNLWNNGGGIRLQGTSHNRIDSNVISGIGNGVGAGVDLDSEANGNEIVNNTITNVGAGIDLTFDCANNSLNCNRISGCVFGIASYPCYNNTSIGNIISNCSSGIDLPGSGHIISKNNVSHCEYGGIKLSSNFTIVSGNLLTHNGMGIWIGNKRYHDNTICCNTLVSNDRGFDVRYCNNNTFYHNNVINNTMQAYLYNSTNIWNAGLEGNYWNNYNGTDLDSDGIGDIPYIIDQHNQDDYPLMNLYTPPVSDMNYDCRVDMRDVAVAAWAIGSYPTHPRWNSQTDVNQDSIVDMKDLILIASDFGKNYV